MKTREKKGLAEALWPTARRAILGLLLMDASQERHLREIARRTSLSPATVHDELQSLVAAGILLRRVETGRAYYHANAACPIYPELRSIVVKTVGLVDAVREALGSVRGIRLAFIFGSIAKGTEDAQSDVDVLIVSDASVAEVSDALLSAQERLGREVTPTVYSTKEFEQRVSEKHHFLARVLLEPKIMLVGALDGPEQVGGDASQRLGGGATASRQHRRTMRGFGSRTPRRRDRSIV